MRRRTEDLLVGAFEMPDCFTGERKLPDLFIELCELVDLCFERKAEVDRGRDFDFWMNGRDFWKWANRRANGRLTPIPSSVSCSAWAFAKLSDGASPALMICSHCCSCGSS